MNSPQEGMGRRGYPRTPTRPSTRSYVIFPNDNAEAPMHSAVDDPAPVADSNASPFSSLDIDNIPSSAFHSIPHLDEAGSSAGPIDYRTRTRPFLSSTLNVEDEVPLSNNSVSPGSSRSISSSNAFYSIPVLSTGPSSGYQTPWDIPTPTSSPRRDEGDINNLSDYARRRGPVTTNSGDRGSPVSPVVTPRFASPVTSPRRSPVHDYLTRRIPAPARTVVAPTYAHSILGDLTRRGEYFKGDGKDEDADSQSTGERSSSFPTSSESAQKRKDQKLAYAYRGSGRWDGRLPFATAPGREGQRYASPGHSPSSIVSGMEWDPSADVGTVTHPSPGGTGAHPQLSGAKQKTDIDHQLQALNIKLAEAEEAHRDTESQRLALYRSLSLSDEYTDGINQKPQKAKNTRSSSMIDLGVIPSAPPGTAVNLIVSNLKTSADVNPASSKESVITVRGVQPPPVTSLYRNSNFNNRPSSQGSTNDAPQFLPSRESATGSHNPGYSGSAVAAVGHQPPEENPNNDVYQRPSSQGFHRAAEDQKKTKTSSKYSYRGRPSEPEDSSEEENQQIDQQEHRQTLAREVSEASTDWEYGHSHSHSHEHSLSDLLNSGITRSELQYSRRNDSSSAANADVSVSVETKYQGESRREHSELGNPPLLLVDRSAQTSFKQHEDDKFRKRNEGKSRERDRRNVDHQQDEACGRPRHHRPHHSDRIVRMDSSEAPKTSSRDRDLTPTCNFIDQFIYGRTPITNENILKAIDGHRYEHIDRVRRELKRIKSLQASLDRARKLESSSTSSNFPSSSDRNGFFSPRRTNRAIQSSGPANRPPHSSHLHRVHSTVCDDRKIDSSGGGISSSTSRSVEPREPRHVDRVHSKHRSSSSTPVAPTPQVSTTAALEAKVEEMISTFYAVLDCVIPGGAVQSSNEKDRTTADSNSARSVPVKPPVSYFLPLPTPLQPIWLRHPPAETAELSSSEKENENGEDMERKQERESMDRETELKKRLATLSLKDIFAQRNFEFVLRARERANVLASIKEERVKRGNLKRDWVRSHGTHDLSSLERAMPPKGPRLMSAREMRKQTQEKYKRLPEVQEKKLQRTSEQEKATNRLMSNYFARQLRKGVLKGQVNVDPNTSVLRK